MSRALLVRLRPTTPWRAGTDSGDRTRVDPVYHSDSLFSAVTQAMSRLGLLEEWLEATARNSGDPEVRFSSCYPFAGDTDLVAPPRTLWPPPASTKVRWKAACFVPIGVIRPLLAGEPLSDEAWSIDAVSQCLLPEGTPGPFRFSVRSNAAVDRLNGGIEWHITGCTEFRERAGLWALICFAGDQEAERWSGPVKGALRLLADSGFGGERSRGWGRCAEPEFSEGSLPSLIFPGLSSPGTPPPVETATPGSALWLLSLFSPAPQDAVDWRRGSYHLITRGGRIESPASTGQAKKLVRMVREGSVLVSPAPLRGSAPDVAPAGFPHPVFRAGFAVGTWLPAPASS